MTLANKKIIYYQVLHKSVFHMLCGLENILKGKGCNKRKYFNFPMFFWCLNDGQKQ